MGKSQRDSLAMRFLWISLLALVLAATVQAEECLEKEKVQLGRKKCVCDLCLDMGEKCKGTAKCDKKCSGSGEVEFGGCTFTLTIKKGKGKISKCSCVIPTEPTTGSGSGETPVPITGSGSGEQPVPITGSGSGGSEEPITGSGSGAPPAGGEGMQCSCKCDCPDGGGECDCDCNCPMTSKAVNCAPGFCKVCPMMGDACPQDMEPICPNNAMSRIAGGAGDGHMADRGCQCVPDFLMDMVKIQPLAPAGRMTAVDRAMTKATIQVGKKKCKCSYEINAKDCKKSKITCDKMCSGKVSGVELEDGMYMLDIAVKKGKVTIAKCDVQAAPAPTGTGGGSGGGMGSGSGSGGGGMGGIGSRCACVSSDMGGTGPVTPTGSGSGTVTTGSGSGTVPTGSGSGTVPTGSGSGPATLLPPTGSGSGSGTFNQKTLPWYLGMDPMELCVGTGMEVIFNKTGHNVVLMATQSDYDGCTGFLGENPTVGNNIDPFIWQAESDGAFFFACGVGTHCSAGGMKAKITVAPTCLKSLTVPWSYGMETQDLCVETGTTVTIDKTGSFHNVNMLATDSDYDTCSGFTDTAGNSDNPFIFQADDLGTFYFACGVGTHCQNGSMKAKVTVSDNCQ